MTNQVTEPVYRCAGCGGIYAEKVSQCDCMPNVQEWIEGTMTFGDPVLDDVTGKWAYSTDEESYRGRFDTEAEAHGAAIDAIESDFGEDGDEVTYWIGRCSHPMGVLDGRECHFGEMVADNIDEWMNDDVAADDRILDMTKEDHEALGRLIFAFVRSRSKVQWYNITDAVKHHHTLGSN